MMLSKTTKNKGTDQTARMRRLVCAFFVRTPPPPKAGFLASRPICSRAPLHVLVRLKLHDPWVCTIISMLVLHDSWVCTIILLGSWVCTIINMCDPSVRPWSASENAHHGLCTFAHYCQLILCRISIELIQTIQFEEELTGTL